MLYVVTGNRQAGKKGTLWMDNKYQVETCLSKYSTDSELKIKERGRDGNLDKRIKDNRRWLKGGWRERP